MNLKDINTAEHVVNIALEIYAEKQEKWDENVEMILKEAFTQLRLKGLSEAQKRRDSIHIEQLNKELIEYQKALDNLRGYIIFLERREEQLLKTLEYKEEHE